MSTLKVGTIQDHANSNTAISIDSSGRVTKPVNPAWRVQLSGAQNSSSSNSFVVNWNDSSTDGCFLQGGCTLSSGQITVPIAGVYQVNSSVRFANTSSLYVEVYMQINNSGTHQSYHIEGDPYGSYHSASLSSTFKLAASDNIRILVNAQGDTNYDIQASHLSHFSGFLVG